MIKWPNIDDLSGTLPIPAGYRCEQLQRSDIPRLASSFRMWFPDVATGTESCYHQEDFYHREVSLKGEPETEIIVLVIKADQELAGMFSVEQSEENLTLYARIGAIAPRHRRAGLTNSGLVILESMGGAMGMALAYFFATLQHPYSQMAAEKAGFRLIGVAPASDRMAIAPGVVKHVYEAIYAKVLAPESDVLRPLAENLTPRTKALFDFLFEQ